MSPLPAASQLTFHLTPPMLVIMLKFYRFVGRLCFPRTQTWEQVRNARTMTFVLVCSLGLALAMAGLIKLLSSPRLLQ